MPTRIELQEGGRIVYCVLADGLTTRQIDELVEMDFAYLEQASQPIYHLVDVSEIQMLPVGMIRYSEAPTFNHRNMGGVVIVGANRFVRMIAQIVFKLAGYDKIAFASTEEEGLDVIHHLIAQVA